MHAHYNNSAYMCVCVYLHISLNLICFEKEAEADFDFDFLAGRSSNQGIRGGNLVSQQETVRFVGIRCPSFRVMYAHVL